MNLTGLLTGIGQAGSDVAKGKLDADEARIKDLFDKLGLKQGQVNLAESQERLKKMQVPNPELEKQTQLRAAFKNIFKRDPTEEEEKMLFGFPVTQQKLSDADKTEADIAVVEKHLGRKLTETELQRYFKIAPPKEGAQKLIQKNEYDPSGHLRYASIDPATQKVIAWGGLVPEKEAFHYWTDDNDQIHATRMPTMKHPNPGEIQMSEEAQKQWGELEGKEGFQKKFTTPKSTGAKPSGGASGGTVETTDPTIIGQGKRRDTVGLKESLKQASSGYTNYVGAQKNAALKSPKGDLAVVFSAVRSAVEGAGRMTNTELEREIKAGSLGQRWERAYTQAVNGTLPDDQRNDLVDVIRNSWSAKAGTAREAWKSLYGEKLMPGFLKDDSDLSDLGPK